MPSRKAQRRNPRPVQQERTTVTAKELLEMGMAPYPNRGLEQPDREGVYAHSFKCRNCALEFVLFSWQANRHTADTVTCPECGTVGRYLHFRTTLTENPKFQINSPAEIYANWTYGGERAQVMDDSDP